MSSRSSAPLALGLCLASSCGGGGGGGSSAPDVTAQFAAQTSAIGEEQASATVAVELLLTNPPLAAELVVRVRDLATGTASEGLDYASFGDQTLVFPAGSEDGASREVGLVPIGDLLIEGREEVVLGLECDAAAIGGTGQHTLALRDNERADVRFVESTGAASSESDGTRSTEVELTYANGLVLDAALEIDVSISSSGGAQDGLDLVHAGSGRVRFPRAASSGAHRSVAVDVLDDGLPEADETAVLVLSSTNPAVDFGGGDTHEFVITDDDVSPDPFLAAATDQTGSMLTIENGGLIDLGTQTIGGSGGAGVQLELANYGLQSLSLGALLVGGEGAREFDVELEAYSFHGSGDGEAQDLPFPYAHPTGASTIDPALAPDLDLLALIGTHNRVRLHGLELRGSGAVALELERVPLPVREDTAILVDGRTSEDARAELLATLSAWRGSVAGHEGSRVFVYFSPHGSRGWIELPNEPEPRHELGCVRESDSSPPGLRVISAREAAELAPGTPMLCAEPLAVPGAIGPTVRDGGSTGAAFATTRLALESDFQLYQRFGSTAATTTYVTELVAAASERFLADAETLLQIAYLRVWSTAADPWNTPDVGGSTFDMLEEFRAAWAPSLGGAWPATAELAHFLSGANLGGGIAYLDTLCNRDYGFGVSANLNGNIDWSSFDGSPSGAMWDFVVFTHELGHNFGALHTHDYCPPLDRCYGSCESGTTCSEGTIMSYCHLCTGGIRNVRLEFHPYSANVIRASSASSCMAPTSLAFGEALELRLRLAPTGASGARNATLSVEHDATNTASPFELALTGQAID